MDLIQKYTKNENVKVGIFSGALTLENVENVLEMMIKQLSHLTIENKHFFIAIGTLDDEIVQQLDITPVEQQIENNLEVDPDDFVVEDDEKIADYLHTLYQKRAEYKKEGKDISEIDKTISICWKIQTIKELQSIQN